MDKYVAAIMTALEQAAKDHQESLKPMWYVTITTKEGTKSVFKYKAECPAQAITGVVNRCLACYIDVVAAEATEDMPKCDIVLSISTLR